MLDQSAVAKVDIDLGVVSFVDESGQGRDVSMVAWYFHELPSVSHCLSCTGLVFNF
jgi:hypothetical protein